MDIATMIGLGTGLLMVLSAMFFSGDALPWIHGPSLLITCGGTLSAVLIHFPASQVRQAIAVAGNCFKNHLPSPADTVVRFRQLAARARRSGLTSLEADAAQEADSFFGLGLELLSNQCDEEELRLSLQREASGIAQRYRAARRLFEVMGAAAPAWGMIGTLIGLVQMLRSLDDPRQIGGGLALALLTTLYGALFSSLICIPVAGKLETRQVEEQGMRDLMTEGLVALLQEHTPGTMEQRLRSWLPPEQRSETDFDQARAA